MTKGREAIFVVRTPGIPDEEGIRSFIEQSGVTLIGAYMVLSGIPVPDSEFGSVDGVEFVMSGNQELFASLLGRGIRIYTGWNITDKYSPQNEDDQANLQLPSPIR